jgi:flagellar L-ring protein precursor FlgH
MRKLRPHLILLSIFVLALINLMGCAGRQPAPPPLAEKEAAKKRIEIKEALIPPVYSDGSLYQSASYLNDLFVDTKARKVGDIVTIQIVESSKASNTADTKTGRTSSLEAGIETLFDVENWYVNKVLEEIPKDLPRPNPFGNPSVKGSMTSDFDGAGATSRSGNLTAFITCRVTHVLPNGNLIIVGSREVLVNHETQLIILSGIIRPRDISDNNVIQSTFISDAKIAYSGTGVINDRQRPGWLANLLNTVWPF